MIYYKVHSLTGIYTSMRVLPELTIKTFNSFDKILACI